MIEARYLRDVGQRFGQLTLLAILKDRINRRIAGQFRCECGRVCAYPVSRVKSGRALTHCGCLTDNSSAHKKHGMRHTSEYAAWRAMKGRCLDPANKDFARWGGRGVSVHPAWVASFEAFYAHIGPRPRGTSLDRIDTRGNYEPGNVRWATPRSQAENTRASWTVEIHGVRFPSVEAAGRTHGVTATTVVRWCDGYSDKRRGNAQTPPRPGCRRWRTYL